MANTVQTFLKNRVLIHVAAWILFFILPLVLAPPWEIESALSEPSNLLSIAVRNIILMGLFYLNMLYLTPVLLKNQGLGIFLVVIAFLVVAVSFINWEIHHTLSEPMRPDFMNRPPMPPGEFRGPGFGPGPGPGPGPRPMMLASSVFASLLITLIIASISTTVSLWSDVMKAKAEDQERAFQRVASELAVLKLQISPHFLFNTLNNIRWLVRSGSEHAEEAVLKLSQLLRFILYQTDHDRIPLDQEVSSLRDYVTLQQLRLAENQALTFSTPEQIPQKVILPLLLIPIAENVFKYGDFTSTFPNRINLTIDGERLIFKTENRIRHELTRDEEASGIGLSNIKQRLILHYRDRHELTYTEKDNVFTLELQLIL